MRKSVIAFVGLVLLAACLGCSGGGGGTAEVTSGTTGVTIRIGQTRAPASAGLSHLSQGIPASVISIRFTISSPTMTPIVSDVPVAGKEEVTVFFEVPNGPNVNFLAEAINSRAQTIYQGLSTASLAGSPVTVSIIMAPTDTQAPVFSGLSGISSVTADSMVLTWEPATDLITPQEEIQYLIYASPISGNENLNGPPAFSPPPRGVTTFTVGGLSPDTPACFIVRARDEWGNVDTNTVERCARTLTNQVTPPEPPPPPPPVAVPNLSVTESCADATAPGQPILLSARLANTGSEALAGIVCSESSGAVLTGVPPLLAIGGVTLLSGSYIPSVSPSPSTVTCTASGVSSATAVSAQASPTPPCRIRTTPSLSVSPPSTCTVTPPTNIALASAGFSAVVNNNGNETLNTITCSSPNTTVLNGVPASLAPNASATVTGSFTVAASTPAPTSVPLSCAGRGAISGTVASVNTSIPCQNLPPSSISVSASCAAREVILGFPVAAIPAPNVSIAATVSNTGVPALNTIACTSTPAATLTGVPATLASGALANVTGNFAPSPSTGPFAVTVGCSGTATTGAPVSANTLAACDWVTGLSQTGASCVTPSAAGSTFTSTLTNTGSESVSGITCELLLRFVFGAGVSFVPFNPPLITTVGSIRPGQQVTVTQTQAVSGLSVARQCSGTGAWSTHAVQTGTLSATCPLPPVTISGTVRQTTTTGPGAAGVVLNLVAAGGATLATATTNASGFYSMQVPAGSSGTLTPTSAGFSFNPVNRTYTNVTTNQTVQDFIRFTPIF